MKKIQGYDRESVLENTICLLFMIAVAFFFTLIIHINFSQNPNFYCTDMYSDMNYAEQVWIHKSIFPDGWVFGNQFYAVGTPVVASLFFGITKNHCLSMAIASTIMSAGILFSFVWMIYPMCKRKSSCVAGLVILLALPLFLTDPISAVSGWQLIYTLCSYYSCYVISAFLSFGCYLRFHKNVSRSTEILLIAAMILSLGCGIQSMRQTVIMIFPLLAVEFISIIIRLNHKQKLFRRETFIVILLSACNFIGIIIPHFTSVSQHQTFGQIKIKSISQIFSSFIPSIKEMMSLTKLSNFIFIVGIAATITVVFFFLQHYKSSVMESKCFLLFFFSIAFVFSVAVFTSIHMRNIYYFMLYPLFSLLIFFIFENSKISLRVTLTSIILCFSIMCGIFGVKSIQTVNKLPLPTDTERYLLEHDIDTIYSCWNLGEKISIESNWKIKAGFWDFKNTTFEEVDYLCNPEIFNSDPNHTAYIFCDEQDILIAEKKASEIGVELTLLEYIPRDNIWIYSAPINLMHKANK